MELKKLEESFSVCKVEDYSMVNLNSAYCFIGKTNEENSLVCLHEEVPTNTIAREDHWKAFRIQGILNFSLIGILSELSTLLAKNSIGIFAISTFNTDYILMKEEQFFNAINILAKAGYEIL